MFKGHPKGLYALALANTGERFGYYTMLAIFVLFLQAKFGFTAAQAGGRLCRGRACCWPMNSSPPALKFCARHPFRL